MMRRLSVLAALAFLTLANCSHENTPSSSAKIGKYDRTPHAITGLRDGDFLAIDIDHLDMSRAERGEYKVVFALVDGRDGGRVEIGATPAKFLFNSRTEKMPMAKIKLEAKTIRTFVDTHGIDNADDLQIAVTVIKITRVPKGVWSRDVEISEDEISEKKYPLMAAVLKEQGQAEKEKTVILGATATPVQVYPRVYTRRYSDEELLVTYADLVTITAKCKQGEEQHQATVAKIMERLDQLEKENADLKRRLEAAELKADEAGKNAEIEAEIDAASLDLSSAYQSFYARTCLK